MTLLDRLPGDTRLPSLSTQALAYLFEIDLVLELFEQFQVSERDDSELWTSMPLHNDTFPIMGNSLRGLAELLLNYLAYVASASAMPAR